MYKKVMLRLIVVAVVLFQMWILQLTFLYPQVGLKVQVNETGQYVISAVDSASAGHKLGIQVGDVIISVNEAAPSDYWALKRFRTLDQANSFILQRNGISNAYDTSSIPTLGFYDVFSLVAQFASLLMAVLLYKKVKDTSSHHLSIVFLLIFLIFMSMSGSTRGDPLGKVVLGSGLLCIPIAFYQFLSVFIKEKANTKLSLSVTKPAYAVVAVMFLIQFIYFLDTPFTYPTYLFISSAMPLICVAGISANLLMLAYIYMKNRNRNLHLTTIIKTVFLSLFSALAPVTFLSFVPIILFGDSLVDPLYTSWFVFILPLTFVYLLATRRLYDIDIIIRRMLFTAAIAFMPSVIFTGTIKLLFVGEANREYLFLIFLILMTGISVILYTLEYVTTRLEPTLFPRKHKLQVALKNIAHNLGTISSMRQMKDVILVDIVQTLEVSGGAIVFEYGSYMEPIVVGNITESEVEDVIACCKVDDPTYICIEISHQEEYISTLVMTQKKSGAMLGAEEVQWLNLIITYLAVSLENVQLIRKLDKKLQHLSSLLPEEENAQNLIWFRKLMFELQEKERVRIATDLHDTTMQDLFYLKSRLQMMQGKYQHSQEQLAEIDSITDYIDVINMGLRQNCFELHPYLLKEMGLVATLNKLLQTERELCGFRIVLVTSDETEIERQNLELKRHVFRVVQELVNNAKKHSRASIVRISIYVEQEFMYFEYVDDGVGFEPGVTADGENGISGIGLEQLKSRILSLGGLYELKTKSGEGMSFLANFPVKQQSGQSRSSLREGLL